MIIGFGNNTVSSLAADITASQTTIQVMPGTGALFARLLTYDYANSSNTLKTYAKITLTDAKETVFEICHLTAVNDDVLTVVRAQEGTEPKGWSLNDVIANFATRGSENQFVQIEELQSGHYTSGVAGGTANALTIALPATYFVNGSTDWTLRTPLVIYPSQNNTGAATLQLTMGGRVLGTFPLYKGNKAQLAANDILKDVGLVCLMDKTKTFFSVANPGAIYAGLGTAAFRDVQTSKDDTTAGRVLVNGGALAIRSLRAIPSGGDVTDVNDLPANSVSFAYGAASNSPGFTGSIIDFSGLSGVYNTQIAAEYANGGKRIAFRTHNGDSANVWNPWFELYHTGNKPTAKDVNALPLSTTVLSVNLNTLGATSSAGVYYQTTTANATVASGYPIQEAGTLVVTPSAYGSQQEYTTFGSGRKFVRGLSGGWNGSNGPWGAWTEYLLLATADGRYQAKGSYYTTSQSDARYNLKNTASKAASGWEKDNSTGMITQWGIATRTSDSTRIAFPTAFPNACANVQLTLRWPGGFHDQNCYVQSPDKTGFTYIASKGEASAYFLAKGY